MMDNDLEKQELSHHDLARQYNRGLGQIMRPHDHDHDQGLRMMNNKHSYFLRAKTPRPSGSRAGDDDEDGEFKKPRARADEHTSLSEEEDLANCLVMLANKSHGVASDDHNKEKMMKMKEVVEKGMFQCKACKKVFNSHQALGGHRASHKKVKGCFASKIEGLNDDESLADEEASMQEDQESLPPPEVDPARPAPSRKRAKMHECSVCRRVFASGQALGGHKRCHWLTTSTDNAFIPNFHDFQYDHRSQQLCKKPILITKPHNLDQHHPHKNDDDDQLDLNLNLPPAPPKHDQNRRDGDDKTGKCEASTRLCLQLGNDVAGGEEGCGMKLRKLSDLRDVNLDGGWLQMGIPSTSEMR